MSYGRICCTAEDTMFCDPWCRVSLHFYLHNLPNKLIIVVASVGQTSVCCFIVFDVLSKQQNGILTPMIISVSD